jgi:hypothetical protein
MIELGMIRDIVTIVGVIVAFTYYALTVRNANKARRKDIIFQKIDTLNDDFWNKWRVFLRQDWETRQEWVEYRREHPESYGFFMYVTVLLSGIGDFLKDGVVYADSLLKVYNPIFIIWTWEKARLIIEDYRTAINDPTYLENFEYLYMETKKRYPEIRSPREYQQIRNQAISSNVP